MKKVFKKYNTKNIKDYFNFVTNYCEEKNINDSDVYHSYEEKNSFKHDKKRLYQLDKHLYLIEFVDIRGTDEFINKAIITSNKTDFKRADILIL